MGVNAYIVVNTIIPIKLDTMCGVYHGYIGTAVLPEPYRACAAGMVNGQCMQEDAVYSMSRTDCM